MKTKTIKRAVYRFGDRGGDMAKAVGSGTIDLARRFGDGTSDLARRIGPRRSLLGLAMIGVAFGGSIVLVRYLRRRKADAVASQSNAELNGTAKPGYPHDKVAPTSSLSSY